VTRYTEGFSHFVTSMTAPVASGWSVRRVGLSPTGKRRLLTAHTISGHSLRVRRMNQIDSKQPFPLWPGCFSSFKIGSRQERFGRFCARLQTTQGDHERDSETSSKLVIRRGRGAGELAEKLPS
jgi:hypothetical protein